MKAETSDLTREKKYEEVGNNYRHFLRWRHALFAGDLLIIYGVVSMFLAVGKDMPDLAWLVPIFASPIGIVFWRIDVRTRELIHATQEAGKALEGEGGGPYSTLVDKLAVPKGASAFSRPTLTAALNLVFLGSSIGMLILAVAPFVCQWCRD